MEEVYIKEKENLIHELRFCLDLRERESGCTFGGGTRCEECAVPYLLLKFLTGEVLHGDIQRLSLTDWREKLEIIT